MDDTTQSRTLDVAASAATCKRHSSILKSQRSPRSPLCELDCNMLTPTNTRKSRVSFSKRTKVAEFATNEDTTTWRNFYEVQNISLESSEHDSAMNHFKQPIGQLRKRILGQQFEEESLELTPEPAMEIHKRSDSRDSDEPTKLEAERDKSPGSEKREQSPQKKSPKKTRSKKPETTVTVQQVIPIIHVEACGEEAERSGSSTSEPRSASGSRSALGVYSSEVSSSFASSNNLHSAASLSAIEWAPASSGDDIMGLIDAIPSMGTKYCRWESVSGPVLSLLLLHSRLRLSMVFGAARPTDRTPLLNVQLETLRQDKENPIAHLCVNFTAEVMRHHMKRGCGAAGDVCQLVRRLTAVAHLSARWASDMYNARLRIAYSLTHDGLLTLKVANTSCRTVWEVVMRVELEVERECAAPWPRAGDVRVTRVLAAPPPARALPDVTHLLAGAPRDWGHAPHTIWKVFRYLKHIKQEDDFLHL